MDVCMGGCMDGCMSKCMGGCMVVAWWLHGG